MPTTDTVTIVFTDLVGSTELSSRVSARDADALRREHFSLLRAAVEANGGTEVKTLGDGLMVVYPSPSAGLAVLRRVGVAGCRAHRTLG
jgi:adenylate cyclase